MLQTEKPKTFEHLGRLRFKGPRLPKSGANEDLLIMNEGGSAETKKVVMRNNKELRISWILLGLYSGYMRVILGLYWDNGNEIETIFDFIGLRINEENVE